MTVDLAVPHNSRLQTWRSSLEPCPHSKKRMRHWDGYATRSDDPAGVTCVEASAYVSINMTVIDLAPTKLRRASKARVDHIEAAGNDPP